MSSNVLASIWVKPQAKLSLIARPALYSCAGLSRSPTSMPRKTPKLKLGQVVAHLLQLCTLVLRFFAICLEFWKFFSAQLIEANKRLIVISRRTRQTQELLPMPSHYSKATPSNLQAGVVKTSRQNMTLASRFRIGELSISRIRFTAALNEVHAKL